MRAWRVHDVGEPVDVFVLEDVDEPTPAELATMGMTMGGWVPIAEAEHPAPDWAILDMRVAALALPDVTMARGTYPVPVPHPYISGQEGVGIVREASAGHAHLVGSRVVGVCIQPWGSLADVAVAVGTSLFEAPPDLSDEEAAAFLIPAHTGYHVVYRRGRVAAGETVLVLGAAGGLGSACVQLAVARGARVVAAVGSSAKATHCLALGAFAAVDHSTEDLVGAVRRVTDGRGVDVVIDPVQGEGGAAARSLVVPDGRHVMCGHAGGLVPIDPHFYVANVTLVGATLGGYPPATIREMFAEAERDLLAMLDAGDVPPHPHRGRRVRRRPRRSHRDGGPPHDRPTRRPHRRLTHAPPRLFWRRSERYNRHCRRQNDRVLGFRNGQPEFLMQRRTKSCIRSCAAFAMPVPRPVNPWGDSGYTTRSASLPASSQRAAMNSESSRSGSFVPTVKSGAEGRAGPRTAPRWTGRAAPRRRHRGTRAAPPDG